MPYSQPGPYRAKLIEREVRKGIKGGVFERDTDRTAIGRPVLVPKKNAAGDIVDVRLTMATISLNHAVNKKASFMPPRGSVTDKHGKHKYFIMQCGSGQGLHGSAAGRRVTPIRFSAHTAAWDPCAPIDFEFDSSMGRKSQTSRWHAVLPHQMSDRLKKELSTYMHACG